jgi:UDP-N-acetylglucosamine:LPS N-acetylglucosamine transferase
MLLQSDLHGESLASEIKKLLEAPELITEMENSARPLANRDAAAAAAALIRDLAERH